MLKYKKITVRKKRELKRILSFILACCLMLPVQAVALDVSEENSSETDVDYVLGDVNLDGYITPADARLALRASARLTVLEGKSLIAADFNGNKILTAADARYILRVAARLDPYANPIVKPPASTTTTEPYEEPTTQPPAVTSKIIDAPLIWQFPDYPAGCEAVAAVMNLKYYKFVITVDDFLDRYLFIGSAPVKHNNIWYSSDPNKSFLGDPRSDKGWGVWAKGLERSIQRCLDSYTGNFSVESTFEESLDSLCEKYIDKNIPVLVWVTAYMEPPRVNITPYIIGTNETFTWISPNHCMLLVGYDENYYYFNDPLTGKLEHYDKIASDIAFEGNGSQAVIITKQ